MLEIESADGGGGFHEEGVVESHGDSRLDMEEVEKRPFVGVVGRDGVADGGSDALIVAAENLLMVERLGWGVGPEGGTDLVVEPFGESLDEPVGEELAHDGGIVVALGFHLVGPLLEARAGGCGKESDVVGEGAWRDEIGE